MAGIKDILTNNSSNRKYTSKLRSKIVLGKIKGQQVLEYKQEDKISSYMRKNYPA